MRRTRLSWGSISRLGGPICTGTHGPRLSNEAIGLMLQVTNQLVRMPDQVMDVDVDYRRPGSGVSCLGK